MSEDTRIHIHKNETKWIFHHETLAPIPTSKGGTGKTRFRVEPTIYVSGVGFEDLDVMNSGAEVMIAMRNYVRMMETIYDYEHLGHSADEITQILENLWNKKESEW